MFRLLKKIRKFFSKDKPKCEISNIFLEQLRMINEEILASIKHNSSFLNSNNDAGFFPVYDIYRQQLDNNRLSSIPYFDPLVNNPAIHLRTINKKNVKRFLDEL